MSRTKVNTLGVIGFMVLSFSAFSQGAHYFEAPIVFEDGIRKSTLLTVKFKYKVFDLVRGRKNALISEIDNQYNGLINHFRHLERSHGPISFAKQIPDAAWGDVWRTNINSGELVRVHDRSQLFSLRFSRFVPIDSIISELHRFDEVEYSHGPIETISLATPNDFNSTSQWNLTRLMAPNAWDITKGSTTVRVGIIEKGGVQRNHEDFLNADGSSQFVPGLVMKRMILLIGTEHQLRALLGLQLTMVGELRAWGGI